MGTDRNSLEGEMKFVAKDRMGGWYEFAMFLDYLKVVCKIDVKVGVKLEAGIDPPTIRQAGLSVGVSTPGTSSPPTPDVEEGGAEEALQDWFDSSTGEPTDEDGNPVDQDVTHGTNDAPTRQRQRGGSQGTGVSTFSGVDLT